MPISRQSMNDTVNFKKDINMTNQDEDANIEQAIKAGDFLMSRVDIRQEFNSVLPFGKI